MRRINELVAYKWKKYEERKELKEQLRTALFVSGFIALIFTGLLLGFVWGG